jgi:predicted ester cyclase
MSVEENKALMQRVYEQVFNQGRLDQIAEFFSADFVDHGAPPPGQERSQGTETIRQFVKALHEALPDARMIVEDEIAEGAKVATRLTLRGTHQGEFMGAAPTGRQVEVGAPRRRCCRPASGRG